MRNNLLGAALLLTGALLDPASAMAQGDGTRVREPGAGAQVQAPCDAAGQGSTAGPSALAPCAFSNLDGSGPISVALPAAAPVADAANWLNHSGLASSGADKRETTQPQAEFMSPQSLGYSNLEVQPLPLVRLQAAPWDTTGQESLTAPIPTGPITNEGIYGAVEFLFMTGTRAIGSQVVATRGFSDTDGSITGTPGKFVGSDTVALNTNNFGPITWVPGYRVTVGYRLEDGVTLSVSYAHLFDAVYSSNAGPVPPSFNPGAQNQDSFLFSPVSNFSPQFSGPQDKVGQLVNGVNTVVGSGGSPYGIWNGATQMDINYLQRFTAWDLTARLPVFETDYSRSYGLAGGRFDWIWERFGWVTQDVNINGASGPQDSASYANIMSQRLYGPFIGSGNEIYLGHAFALSLDLSAAALYGITKEKASYTLGDGSVENKRQILDFELVPEVQASLNVTWYPLKGVEIRTGYNLWGFFNTQYMQSPIGFNQGYLEPGYGYKFFRLYQGINVGISYTF